MPDLYKSSSTAQKFKGGKKVIVGINQVGLNFLVGWKRNISQEAALINNVLLNVLY